MGDEEDEPENFSSACKDRDADLEKKKQQIIAMLAQMHE